MCSQKLLCNSINIKCIIDYKSTEVKNSKSFGSNIQTHQSEKLVALKSSDNYERYKNK